MLENIESRFVLEEANDLESMDRNISLIVQQYSSRPMAGVQVRSYLGEKMQLGKDWIVSKGIKSPDDLQRYVTNLQKKVRKGVVANRKEEAIKLRQEDVLDEIEKLAYQSEMDMQEKIKKSSKFAEGGLLAPNGKTSNLTPEQYRLVRTPEFKAWFGNWENDPDNASKVVDDNGEPLVCYHGTAKAFNKFNKKFSAQGVFWFSSDRDKIERGDAGAANRAVIIPVFLNAKKIAGWKEYERLGLGQIERDYDGIKLDDDFVMFKAQQIKLANGKNTTFDATNADIRKEQGGDIQSPIALPDTYSTFDSLKPILEKQGYSLGKTNAAHEKDIVCVNCGWSWNTSDSDENDKYVCHKCDFDNTLYYDDIMGKLRKPLTIGEIAALHGVEESAIQKQLDMGIEVEKEHTDDTDVAQTIALHHLEEVADYYDKLKIVESPSEDALKEGEPVVEYRKDSRYQSGFFEGKVVGVIIKISDKMAKVEFPNGSEEWHPLTELKRSMPTTDEFKDGGVVVGKRHSESDENGTGERFIIKSTGQMVEVEGGEGVLCSESMNSDKIYHFEGKKMTGREIASKLNNTYGGVEFAEGGHIPNKVCGCKFYHGGELPSATLDGLNGGEAVVTVKTMESKDTYNFGGVSMTPRKILSKINADHGGKKFEEGGTIDISKHKLQNEITLTKMVYFSENLLHLV